MTTDAPAYQEVLRRLALSDERFLAAILGRCVSVPTSGGVETSLPFIDDHTRRLVDLAALVAVGAGAPGISAGVDAAFGAGAGPEEVVGVLCSIAHVVGANRVVKSAPHVAAAVGYDLDADLEELHPGGSDLR